MRKMKLVMPVLLLSLLTLNGCMLGHLFTDDESGMNMHESMPKHEMMHADDE